MEGAAAKAFRRRENGSCRRAGNSPAPAGRRERRGRRLADVRGAERDLGFTAELSLAEGLADLVQWWRSQGANLPPLVASAS